MKRLGSRDCLKRKPSPKSSHIHMRKKKQIDIHLMPSNCAQETRSCRTRGIENKTNGRMKQERMLANHKCKRNTK